MGNVTNNTMLRYQDRKTPNFLVRVRKKLVGTWGKIKKAKMSYILMAPYLIIFFLFVILPLISAIFISFTYFNVLEFPKFVGINNYLRLFIDDDIFLLTMKNTFIFAIITGPIGYVLSFILAWMINDLPPIIRAITVTIFYAPSISGQVYFMWQLIFSGDAYGYANGTLMKLGIIRDPIQWLQDPVYVRKIVIIVALWMSLGAGFLAFIAGLKGVDKNLYEAGYVDGIRNRIQELWYITLPSMKPQLLFGAIMSITSSFAASDVTISLAGFPSTDYTVDTIVTHLMDYGNVRFEMGYACSIATVLFVIVITINTYVQKLIEKVGR